MILILLENYVNLTEIDLSKEVVKSDSLLEFLLMTLSKNLNLKPKQVKIYSSLLKIFIIFE